MNALSPRMTAVRSDRIDNRHDKNGMQRMHFPKALVEDVQEHADRAKRDPGWCLWMAWCLAAIEIDDAAFDRAASSPLLAGDMECVEVVLPLGTWRDLTLECERRDRSKSWMLARAWVLGRDHFELAVPS